MSTAAPLLGNRLMLKIITTWTHMKHWSVVTSHEAVILFQYFICKCLDEYEHFH
jgi:hypothetical protein